MRLTHIKSRTQRSPSYASVAAFTLIEILVVLVVIGIISTVTVLTMGDGGRRDKLQDEATRLHGVLKLAQEEAQLYGVEFGLSVEPHNYQFVTFGRERWTPVADDKAYKRHRLDEEFQLALKIEGFKLGKQNGMLPGADIKDGKVVVREEEDDDNADDKDEKGNKNETNDDDNDDAGDRLGEDISSDIKREDGATGEATAGQNRARDTQNASRRRKTYLPQVFLLSSGEVNPFTLTIGSSEGPALFYRIRGKFDGSIKIEGPIEGDLIAEMDKPWQAPKSDDDEQNEDDEDDEADRD